MAPDTTWSLHHLELENFRQYEHFEIDLDERLTVLVGKNGSGKSAILDATSIALGSVLAGFGGKAPGIAASDARVTTAVGDAVRVSTTAAHYPVSITAAGRLAGRAQTWTRTRNAKSGRTTWGDNGIREVVKDLADDARSARGDDVVLPVIAYYGIERLVGVRKLTGHLSLSERSSAYENALDPKSDMHRLQGYVSLLAQAAYQQHTRTGADDSMAARQLAAISLACDRALGSSGWHAMSWDPVLKEITLESEAGLRLPLSSLSSGIRIIAGLVIDIASRMGRANPTLGDEDLLARAPGIVLIDEVDLHLHPTWQQQVVTTLRQTFPAIQLIVSTHSPQTLSALPASSIRILTEEGVRQPEFAEGLGPEVILESIQETNPVPLTPTKERLHEYLELVIDKGEGESPRARRLREELDEKTGGAQNVPQLADADAFMTFSL